MQFLNLPNGLKFTLEAVNLKLLHIASAKFHFRPTASFFVPAHSQRIPPEKVGKRRCTHEISGPDLPQPRCQSFASLAHDPRGMFADLPRHRALTTECSNLSLDTPERSHHGFLKPIAKRTTRLSKLTVAEMIMLKFRPSFRFGVSNTIG
ncbi:hypothetical protein [Novosphingobium sp. PhB55]|uniref:hypothetical protein n=1 Tax=Novosphingobium sp. PhB55 TaxID=2485106 RepID=UPI0010668098|nr:hypothetical protein [Novosphingobium sp. PhB55]